MCAGVFDKKPWQEAQQFANGTQYQEHRTTQAWKGKYQGGRRNRTFSSALPHRLPRFLPTVAGRCEGERCAIVTEGSAPGPNLPRM